MSDQYCWVPFESKTACGSTAKEKNYFTHYVEDTSCPECLSTEMLKAAMEASALARQDATELRATLIAKQAEIDALKAEVLPLIEQLVQEVEHGAEGRPGRSQLLKDADALLMRAGKPGI